MAIFHGEKEEKLTSRVQSVNVQAEVDRVLRAHTLANLLDDALGSDGVNLARLYNLEAAVAVILVVRRTAERRADAGVDVGIVAEQAFHRCVVEVGAVIDAGDLGRRATKNLGTPCELRRRRIGQWICFAPVNGGMSNAYMCRDGCRNERPTRGRRPG